MRNRLGEQQFHLFVRNLKQAAMDVTWNERVELAAQGQRATCLTAWWVRKWTARIIILLGVSAACWRRSHDFKHLPVNDVVAVLRRSRNILLLPPIQKDASQRRWYSSDFFVHVLIVCSIIVVDTMLFREREKLRLSPQQITQCRCRCRAKWPEIWIMLPVPALCHICHWNPVEVIEATGENPPILVQ